MKKKKQVKEADEEAVRFRQCIIQGMNESITLSSNYPGENMRYLSNRALRMYSRIRSGKE